MEDEKALVKKAKAGNQQALAKLLHDNYHIVFGYLLKTTLNQGLAEDIVQDTMVRAIERIHSYRGRGKFSTWLISIATNIYRDQLRRQKVGEKAIASLNSPGFTVDRLDPNIRSEVQEALMQLSPEMRAALVLRYFYEYSYKEIARIVGVPVGTVRSRLHNGIEKLRQLLDTAVGMLLFLGVMWK